MKIAGLRAVLFDLDDTLYPERAYTLSGARAVSEYLEMPEALPELLALEDEDPAGPLYSRWLAARGLEERLLPELLHVHRTHRPAITLDEAVCTLLERLRSRFALGLVSDGRLAQQQTKADVLGLDRRLDVIVFSDSLGRGRWKPDPAPYESALARLGVAPTEAVYVGDNPAKDFLGARRAGMRSIRLRRPDGLHAAAEPASREAAPDLEIRSLLALEEFLG